MHTPQLLLTAHIPCKLLGPKKLRTKIYVLFDSRYSYRIRYIGLTIQSLKDRLKGHIGEAKNRKTICNCHRCNWIRLVLAEGGTVCIMLIDEYIGNGSVEEIAWIKYGKEEGWDLTNISIGGQGGNLSQQTKLKIRLKLLGKKHSIERRINESKSHIGLKLTEDQKRKIGIKSKNRKCSEYTRKLIGDGNRGKHRTEEEKQHLRDINLGKIISKESINKNIITRKNNKLSKIIYYLSYFLFLLCR